MKEQNLGRGHQIIGFDSMEEMLRYMATQEQAATEVTLPEQWEIGWGDRVHRLVEGLSIFGHIYDPDEFLSINTQPGQEPDEEIRAELEDLRAAYQRGYRYGRWYSEVEPTGEYGSAHVVNLWRITEEDFEVARRNDWKLWPELALRLHSEIQAAHTRKEEDGEEE